MTHSYYNVTNMTHEQRMAIIVINHLQLRCDSYEKDKKLSSPHELAYLSALVDGIQISQSVLADEAKLSLSKVIADYRKMIDDSKNSTGQLSAG